VDIAAVLRAALAGYRAQFGYLVVLTLSGYMLLGAATVAAAVAVGGWAGTVLLATQLYVGGFWVQGLVVQTAHDLAAGDAEASFAARLARVWRTFNALSVCSLLAGMGVLAGLACLVLPGIYLWTIWALLVPAVVIEGHGPAAAFARSRELVRRNAWPVFCVSLLAWAGTALVSWLVGAAARAALGDGLAGTVVGQIAAVSLVLPFSALAVLALYRELTSRHRSGADGARALGAEALGA
jgi:hypothetical protein